jgi:hypothetical protein
VAYNRIYYLPGFPAFFPSLNGPLFVYSCLLSTDGGCGFQRREIKVCQNIADSGIDIALAGMTKVASDICAILECFTLR